MTWYYVNCSFILIFTWISYTNSIPGYSIEAPKSVTVQRGLCVHIPCHFTVEKSVTLSERNTEGLWFNGTDKNPPPVAATKGDISEATKGRFFLTGEVWKGDCSLSINDAVPSDSSFYLFRLIYSNKYSFSNIKPEVTVIELTDKPEISLEKTLVAGKEVTLTCTSPGRCNGSTPLITWSGVQGKVVTYTADYPDGNKTYYSNITFTPSRLDNTFPLSCTVNFQKSNTSTSQKMILNVEYPPIITINTTVKGNTTTENTTITVLEGDSLVIICIVDSNPQANISWYDKDKLLNGSVHGKLLSYELRNISSNNTGRYQCKAQNYHWINNRTVEIIVQYVPRMPKIICATNTDCFIKNNNTIYATDGSTLSLKCTAEASPVANLTWIKSGNPITGGLSIVELRVSDVTFRDEGLYICNARNSIGSSNTRITIKIPYKPRESPSMHSCCMDLSSKIECNCIILAFPEATTQWTVDDKSYPSSYNDNNLHISTVISDSESISNLVMNLSQGYIPNIQCRSSNQQGELVLQLLHGTQTSPKNNIIIAAVCAVVIITVLPIKGVLLLKYYRRKKKNEPSTKCNVIHGCSTGEFTPEAMPEESKAPADPAEDNVQYASIVLSQLKPRVPKEVVEMEYACIKFSRQSVKETSQTTTKF